MTMSFPKGQPFVIIVSEAWIDKAKVIAWSRWHSLVTGELAVHLEEVCAGDLAVHFVEVCASDPFVSWNDQHLRQHQAKGLLTCSALLILFREGGLGFG